MSRNDLTEHRNDQLEEDLEYPPARDQEFWEGTADQNLLQFKSELEQVNEKAAHVLDHRMDIGEYPQAERNEMINAYAQAFKRMEFHHPAEKWETAREISQTLFKPMTEYLNQESEFNHPGEKSPRRHHQEVLFQYSDSFAAALDGTNHRNRPNTQAMDESIEGARDYLLNEDPKGPEITNEEQFSEFTRTDFRHQWIETLKLVNHTWRGTEEALERMNQDNDPNHHGASRYLQVARDIMHQYKIQIALEDVSYEEFKRTNETARTGREEFSQAIQHNQGFIGLKNYVQAELPEKFESIQDALQYTETTQEQLEKLRGNEQAMSPLAHQTAFHIYESIDSDTAIAEWYTGLQGKNKNPEINKQYAESVEQYLKRAHRSAQAVQFIMRPRENPETNSSKEQPGF